MKSSSFVVAAANNKKNTLFEDEAVTAASTKSRPSPVLGSAVTAAAPAAAATARPRSTAAAPWQIYQRLGQYAPWLSTVAGGSVVQPAAAAAAAEQPQANKSEASSSSVHNHHHHQPPHGYTSQQSQVSAAQAVANPPPNMYLSRLRQPRRRGGATSCSSLRDEGQDGNINIAGSGGGSASSTAVCVKDLGLYRGPERTPEPQFVRYWDTEGPVEFAVPPLHGALHQRAELRKWPTPSESLISQNSSKRVVIRGVWLPRGAPSLALPVAVKYVEDWNARDGRSIKREVECHLFIAQRLSELVRRDHFKGEEDAWPSAELLGYHLDRRNPGRCVLITRKLSGPDFFDLIRQEHQHEGRQKLSYEYHKLHWCLLALKRVQQYAHLGIRHNDIKPDNIVIDVYTDAEQERKLDVKLIDLGTASMHHAKEFTGGTSWYESPEQKVLEFHSKRQRNPEAARKVEIGLRSDVWAAGLSVTEVLAGRRVVDTLKGPEGPGPLEYRGMTDGWTLEPAAWVATARVALLGKKTSGGGNSQWTFCYDAAKQIFDQLVVPEPSKRATLGDAISIIEQQMDLALQKSRRSRRQGGGSA